MTIHQPTVLRIQPEPRAWPTYEIDWADKGEPVAGDLVLMTAELFEQAIRILSGEPLGWPRTPPEGSCTSCPNRDPQVGQR